MHVHRFASVLLAFVLAGCPADGPPVTPNNGGTAPDAGNNTGTDEGMEEGLQLSELNPVEGPMAGGTEVVLTGSGFMEGMTVRFGSGSAVDATITSVTEASVTTPGSPTSGSVAVVVRNPDGESDSLLNGFRYLGEGETPEVGFCQLQAQSPVSATTGVATDGIYAVVFVDGVTNAAGQGSGVDAELGWGADDDYQSFNFVPMTYNLDQDGLTEGDLANDEYGAALTIPTAGTYRYAARFRIAGEEEWTYCDLDASDDAVVAEQLGVIEVTDPAQPMVGFCQTQPPTLLVETGAASASITGTVFVAGETVGDGAGDVEAEIIYGPDGTSPSTWTDTAAATYAGDVDGLTPGDKANDAWSGTITATSEGDYGYAFRFSADGGASWQLCDLDGATGADDFDENNVGLLEVRDVIMNLADNCNLQFPHLVETGEVGEALEFYGRVTEAGVTGAGGAPAVQGELLVGPVGMDPRPDATGFEVSAASYNANAIDIGPDEDEYAAMYTPTSAGEYAFAYRFSVDGGTTWKFCALEQAGDSFSTDQIGHLYVTDGTPDTIDFCHVWQDTLTDTADPNDAPLVTVEVFEAGITDSAGDPTELEVETAALPLGSNPAIASAPWISVPYKAPRPGVPQNYEYEGTVYTPQLHPAAGMHNVAVRVRKAGSTLQWTYCDTDESTQEFRVEALTRLTVSP